MSRQSNFTTDITKSFRNLKVNDKKKNKRLSLTDSEASDSTPVIPPSRSRGVGGAVVTSWKGDSSREGSHAREMQKIKSSLQPYAASDISAESVHSLAVEYNVDQTIAEDAVKSSPNHEAAREKIIQFLKRRIDHEKHLARNNNNNSSSRPPAYPTDYKNEYHVPPPNIYNREPHTRTHRGSPDGASLRAESPVGLYGHNGHQNKLVNKVNNFRQQIARSDYDILPRKNQLDPTKVTRQYIVPDRTPATDPPAYPGNQAPLTNSLPYSRRSSTSENGNDVSSRNAQHNSLPRPNHILPNPNTAADVQYRRGQTPPPNLTYERNMNSSTSAGISPGHVNKIVQSWSPSEPPPNSGNLYRQANSRPQQNVPVPQMTSSSVMPKNHKPIIKGSVTTISQPAPTNHQGSRFTPSHPPPSYTVAQQFKSKQKEMGASGYTHPDNPYSVDVQNQPHIVRARTSPGPYSDQQMSNPINVALLGNISYASYPHPHPSISGHSSSPQSSISSGYQLTVEPCPAQYHTLRNPQILQASGQPVVRPQPMQVEVPRNCEAVPGRYAQMPMESDMIGVQALSDRNLRYHHYMTEREPPSYVESLSGGSTSLTSSDMTANYRDGDINYMTEDHKSRKSNVAENYLNAVDNSGNGNPVLVKPPKGTETAVQAARVTASNSKRQHACSYSAVADAKQRKPGSMSGLNDPPRSPMHVDVPPEDTVDPRDKTVSMSPVPVRKKHKPKTSSKRNGHSSESEEEDEGQERNGSRARMFSSDAYKFYMEQHIENVFKNCNSRISRRDQLEQEMKKLNLPAPEQSQMRGMLFQKESNYIRLKRGKIDLSMFQTIKPLGVGAFGRVFLAKKTGTGKLYAIKTLRKKEVLTRNQVAHVKAERDILSEADNDWVVKLYYTFQDKQFLYFVMDYIPGGDMMSLLIKKGIFEESLAQFYTAELTLALESVHRMGFIHRDIKPDNILIDRDGHIKLTDFGLCTGFRWTHDSKYYQRGGHRQQDSMDFSNEWHKHNSYPLKTLDRRRIRDANRHIARSLVGTPNYIAPEVLLREGYTQLCDWWSVGVILYEMVVGQPPFNADTPQETQIKVVNWETILCFPDTARLKRNTKDFIRRLCCGQSQRLGCRGIDEIKGHPYFRHIDWVNLRNVRAPFVPKIKYAEDTSNFDAPDDDTFNQSQAGTLNNTLLRAGEHAFFEFTFRRFFDEDGRAYSSQHYTPDNNMTIDEAAELAHSDDYSNQYYQANGEWSQGGGGGHNNGGRAASNDGFYF